eukprot:TRINITY_DN26063_c0_g1_i1.p1 TRINITY_DN26063_c0_g1~~TRINITY_DN26063_c0_g1_i1.p1  ORF type:complete len:410 (-),score=122.56 TRINITY_DN26063_c0_g1_i1:95-1324(-)
MAERQRISIAAGQRQTVTLCWRSKSETTGVEGPPSSVRWSIVVLNGLTVDLKITAKLTGEAASLNGDADSDLVVRPDARGTTFFGTFMPSKSKRLATLANIPEVADSEDGASAAVDAALSAAVDKLLFDFSNAFSWFTAKEIEVVTLRDWPAPISRPPPALCEVAPLDSQGLCGRLPPPRSSSRRGGGEEGAEDVNGLPVLLHGGSAPALRPKDTVADTANGHNGHDAANGHAWATGDYAAAVASWLADAVPAGSEQELADRVASLREHCLQGAASLPRLRTDQDMSWGAEESPTPAEETEEDAADGPTHFFIGEDDDDDAVEAAEYSPQQRHDAEAVPDYGHSGEDTGHDRSYGYDEAAEEEAVDDSEADYGQDTSPTDIPYLDDEEEEEEQRRARAREKAKRMGRMM